MSYAPCDRSLLKSQGREAWGALSLWGQCRQYVQPRLPSTLQSWEAEGHDVTNLLKVVKIEEQQDGCIGTVCLVDKLEPEGAEMRTVKRVFCSNVIGVRATV